MIISGILMSEFDWFEDCREPMEFEMEKYIRPPTLEDFGVWLKDWFS